MDLQIIDHLRADLSLASFSVQSVHQHLGQDADAARLRGVLQPAKMVCADRAQSSLNTIIKLFLLGEQVSEEAVAHALPQTTVSGAEALELIERKATSAPHPFFTAAISLNPIQINDSLRQDVQEWFILSDLDDHLRSGPVRAHHVMGIGGATRSLISLLPPQTVDSSLDLGTGCGIVALHLSLRGAVVATDISSRALMFARANARLNNVENIKFLLGDLFEPVANQRFDLIASNPPFVVTPRGEPNNDSRYEYRDAGLIGDALAQKVVEQAPNLLRSGGQFLCLANWESHWGTDAFSRVQRWIDMAQCNAEEDGYTLASWVIEREKMSPTRYAETWARDGGAKPGEEHYDTLVSDWLNDFSERRVTSIGLGSVRIQKLSQMLGQPRASDVPTSMLTRLEHAEGFYSEFAGAVLDRAFQTAIVTESLSDKQILSSVWYRDAAVSELRNHVPGEEAPSEIWLETPAGIARRVSADPLLAAMLGVCDGDLNLMQISAALAEVLTLDLTAVQEALVLGVRELVWLGMLHN